jgi:hypothetical protein
MPFLTATPTNNVISSFSFIGSIVVVLSDGARPRPLPMNLFLFRRDLCSSHEPVHVLVLYRVFHLLVIGRPREGLWVP